MPTPLDLLPKRAESASEFLCRVARRLRKDRARFVVPRSFMSCSGTYAAVWYPTRGCRRDFAGFCTMCNYGFPQKVQPYQMADAVREALEALPPDIRTIHVSPFNTFDETEVPASIRETIFSMLGSTSAEFIICESHATTIRFEAIADCVERLGGKKLCIQIGIESMNDFVRNCCINKGLQLEQITAAVDHIHAAGAFCTADLLFGAPFLGAHIAIDDVVSSVRAADQIGVDWFTIFPSHAKPHTIIGWLSSHGEYSVPSLWGLVDILDQLSEPLKKRTFFAWLEQKEHPGSPGGLVPKDDIGVSLGELLSSYTQNHEEKTLRELLSIDNCERASWRKEVIRSRNDNPVEVMKRVFPRLAKEVLGDEEWWCTNERQVIMDIEMLWETSNAPS
jgi:radical SAM enzyme (TIGR01210 family)